MRIFIFGKNLRRLFQRNAIVETKVVKTKKDDEGAQKSLNILIGQNLYIKAPSHRLLAMLRAEAEGYVKLNVAIENDEAIAFIETNTIKNNRKQQINYVWQSKIVISDC